LDLLPDVGGLAVQSSVQILADKNSLFWQDPSSPLMVGLPFLVDFRSTAFPQERFLHYAIRSIMNTTASSRAVWVLLPLLLCLFVRLEASPSSSFLRSLDAAQEELLVPTDSNPSDISGDTVLLDPQLENPICEDEDRCYNNPGPGDGYLIHKINGPIRNAQSCRQDCGITRICVHLYWWLEDTDDQFWCLPPTNFLLWVKTTLFGWECGTCPALSN